MCIENLIYFVFIKNFLFKERCDLRCARVVYYRQASVCSKWLFIINVLV